MCSPEDSCASVTSGFSPIAFVLPAWLYPDNCSPAVPPRGSKLEPAKLRRGVLLSGMPTLRRDHDRDTEIYGCGIIHVRLLRFFVACPPLAAHGCALARRRTRVPAASPPSLRPLSAYARAHLQHHSDNPDGIPTTPRCSPQPLFKSTLPFKSHSAPRPPQTPAASS